MVIGTKTRTLRPQTIEVYLGFKIVQIVHDGEDTFVATPSGWTARSVTTLEATDLPALRQRIWGWWHHLLE